MTTGKRNVLSTAVKTRITVSSFLGFAIVSCLVPFPGEAKKPGTERPRLVPRAMMKWPEKGSPYAVLVDKSQQKIFLYHKKDPFRPEKVYPCSTGENEGRKSRQNDRRTPEGIYFFTKSYVEKYLYPIYGERAFPLDYPNPLDQNIIDKVGAKYSEMFNVAMERYGAIPMRHKKQFPCIDQTGGFYDVLKRIKKVLDPNNILNSDMGIFPPEED